MASRKDVAREAGVSAASVSYYINHNGYVSEEAGKRIQAAIEKLNYSPNQIARSLKIKDSKQFVFLCNEIRNPFFAQLVYKATKEAYREDYFILFSNVINDDNYLRKICSYQVSGLFLSNGRIQEETLQMFVKQRIPTVMLQDIRWDNIDENISRIEIHNEVIFKEIIAHLQENGYHDSCYISSSRSEKRGELDEKTINFMEAAGSSNKHSIIYNIADAREAFDYIIHTYTKSNCPDSFICSNDAVAVGVVKGVLELGLKIPQDVAVIGYDNTFQSQFGVPSITSVDIKTETLGETVIQMLLDKVRGLSVPDYEIYPKLMIRESSRREKDRL